MGVDLTRNAVPDGATYPIDATESTFQEGGPLVSPEQLRLLHLFGVPLVSAIPDPVTKQVAHMSDDVLKFYIQEAVAIAELETGLSIFPAQHVERHPYDQAEQQQGWGYMVLNHRPVIGVQAVEIRSSDGINVFGVPPEWVERGYLSQGRFHVIPFSVGVQSGTVVSSAVAGSVGLVPSLFRQRWVPALWTVTYTVGFPAAKIPRVLNQLIGLIAAMEVLSMLATTYARVRSASLSIDGLGQSQTFPGAEIFAPRLQELAAKRKFLVGRLRNQYNLGIIADNV